MSRGSVPTTGIRKVFCVRDECDAVQYDGGFELAFLRHGESVGAARGMPGRAQVDTRDGEEIVLEQGDWLVRKSDGELEHVDADRFAVEFVDPNRPAGYREVSRDA